MKRLFTILLGAMLIFQSTPTDACTNLIVGKKASTDGSVICTYNCDGFGFAASLSFYMPGMHPADEVLNIRGWGPQAGQRLVKQVPYTFGVVGLMNDHQVSIVETTWNGREELHNPEGYFDYFSLMHITLQRASTAREAIQIMHDLVTEYGYNSTGESFAVCDKNEAWIMEMIGKGKGRKGAIWIAMRVPDDCITAYANSSRIMQFPQAKILCPRNGILQRRGQGLQLQGRLPAYGFQQDPLLRGQGMELLPPSLRQG